MSTPAGPPEDDRRGATSTHRPATRLQALVLVALGLLPLWCFTIIRDRYGHGNRLDLGSLEYPAPGYAQFLLDFLFFGGAAALVLTLGLAGLGDWPRLRRLWRAGGDRAWITAFALLAMAVPALIRLLVLDGAPLSDDESAYQFSAELLAQGRLSVPSPPEKLFFDRQFMVNDGRFYSQYFLGWPALMVPFVWLGLPGLAAPFYSGLAVPALFLAVRQLTGPAMARGALLLYLSSPLLMIGAATQMSHTACLCALAWLTCLVQRARRPGAAVHWHAAVALLFCLCFFIRPLTAVGVGGPFLLWWAAAVLRQAPAQRRRNLVAFLVPALAMAALFLLVNQLQNGSPLRSAYRAAFDHARANGFRFTNWTPRSAASELSWWGIDHALSNLGVALLRGAVEVFGWPCSFLLLPLAWRAPGAGAIWAAFWAFLGVNLFVKNVGIDSFAPVHYFELVWPVLLLSAVGLDRAGQWLSGAGEHLGLDRRWASMPCVALGVLVSLDLLLYLPVRLAALDAIVAPVNAVLQAPERAGLAGAVVFAPRPLAPPCTRRPTAGWVFWRPNNDPGLRRSVLWANHVSVEADRRLMRHFPGRRGYVLHWNQQCQLELHPLDELRPGEVPPGFVGGVASGLPR